MLSLFAATQSFSSPTVHVAQPVVRSSPMQMMQPEMPSRRAALLSAASLMAVPFAAQAKPEDYAGGCEFAPRLFYARAQFALEPASTLFAVCHVHLAARLIRADS